MPELSREQARQLTLECVRLVREAEARSAALGLGAQERGALWFGATVRLMQIWARAQDCGLNTSGLLMGFAAKLVETAAALDAAEVLTEIEDGDAPAPPAGRQVH
jgi:hypothetical protein